MTEKRERGEPGQHPHERAAKSEVDERVRHGSGEAQAAVDEPIDDADAATPRERGADR